MTTTTPNLIYKDVTVVYTHELIDDIPDAVVAIIDGYHDDEFSWDDFEYDPRVFFYCRDELEFFEMTLAASADRNGGYYFVEQKESN